VDPRLDGWKHLVPKALGIGPSNTPVRKATVVHSGKEHVFWCDTGSGESSVLASLCILGQGRVGRNRLAGVWPAMRGERSHDMHAHAQAAKRQRQRRKPSSPSCQTSISGSGRVHTATRPLF